MAVLTLAVDPFSQQLLQLQQDIVYVDGLDDEVFALRPRVNAYTLGNIVNPMDNLSTSRSKGALYKAEIRGTQLDFSMEAAILNGLAQSKETVQQQSMAICPTGNCTWNAFPTLGVCHRCSNLTSQLKKVDHFGDFFDVLYDISKEEEEPSHWSVIGNATAFALPNGHFLANVDGCDADDLTCRPNYMNRGEQDAYALTAYSTGDWNKTVSLQDVNTLIQSMSVIYVDGEKLDKMKAENSTSDDDDDGEDPYKWQKWPQAPVVATECGVYFCVKEIESRMEGNVLVETATEAENYQRVYGQGLIDDYEPSEVSLTLEFVANKTEEKFQEALRMNYTDATDVTATYEVHEMAYRPITNFFQQTMTTTWNNETAVLNHVRQRIPNIKEMFNGAVVGPIGSKPNALASIWKDFRVDLEDNFESLAISMTNDIRKNGESNYDDVLEKQVIGQVGVPRTAYNVVWYWFILHAVILIGSVIFCIATMIMSRDVPVWKSHSLATMSQGPTVIDFGPEAKSLGELEERAKGLQVSLSGDDKNQLLRRRDDRSATDEGSSTEEGLGISTGRHTPV